MAVTCANSRARSSRATGSADRREEGDELRRSKFKQLQRRAIGVEEYRVRLCRMGNNDCGQGPQGGNRIGIRRDERRTGQPLEAVCDQGDPCLARMCFNYAALFIHMTQLAQRGRTR